MGRRKTTISTPPKRCRMCKKLLRADNSHELCSYHYMIDSRKKLKDRISAKYD